MRPPQDLESIQQWFASIICQPLTENQEVNPSTIRGSCIKEESLSIIQPSKTMHPHERIQVYNQQYWWRFYSIMQDQYPLLTRIFGFGDFNKLFVIDYLQAYPSKDWTLRTLGSNLVKWMKKSYKEPDKSFVIKCAEIDHAFHTGSYKKNFKPHKNTLSQEEIINAKYKLQPYVSLFSLNGSYLSFREEILTKDPQWWVDNDFPVLNKDRNYFYLIYRAPDGYMYWQEISKAQFLLLKAFKQGATLSEACGLLEDDEEYFLEAIDNIQYWFQNWSELNLLAIRKR